MHPKNNPLYDIHQLSLLPPPPSLSSLHPTARWFMFLEEDTEVDWLVLAAMLDSHSHEEASCQRCMPRPLRLHPLQVPPPTGSLPRTRSEGRGTHHLAPLCCRGLRGSGVPLPRLRLAALGTCTAPVSLLVGAGESAGRCRGACWSVPGSLLLQPYQLSVVSPQIL